MSLENGYYVIYIIGGGIAFLAWFIRLEAKVLYLEKDHAKLSDNFDHIQGTLTDILKSIARIEGKLESRITSQREG